MSRKKNPKMLVIDDEPDITAGFQSFFGRRGFSVNTTASGRDALAMIKTSQPDLVFLDLTLSEMDGFEVLKELREYDKKTKVIVVTGHVLESEKEEAEFNALGISAYLNKPINLEELASIVESVLGDTITVKNFEKYKLLKKEERPLPSVVHKFRNLLGNMRNECEVFLLNKKDGIYNQKSHADLENMAEEIMRNVIKTVDETMKVFDRVKEDK